MGSIILSFYKESLKMSSKPTDSSQVCFNSKKQIMNYKDPIKDLLQLSKGLSKYYQTITFGTLSYLLGPFQYNSIQDTLLLTCCTKRQPCGVPFLVPNTQQTCNLYYSTQQLYGESDLISLYKTCLSTSFLSCLAGSPEQKEALLQTNS